MEKKQEEDQTTVVEKREEHNRQYKKALIERRQQGLHRAKLVGVRQKEELGDEETCFSLVLKGELILLVTVQFLHNELACGLPRNVKHSVNI